MPSSDKTLEALKARGVVLPRHPASQERYATIVSESLNRLDAFKIAAFEDDPRIRKGNAVTFSLPRYFDPRASFDSHFGEALYLTDDDRIRQQIVAWCRLFEATHPIVGACIDIYSRFPVAELDIVSNDKALDDFYSELFFDRLDLQEHFIMMGREYWTVGEVFSIGDWDADLGIWRAEEILWPDDVVVERPPLLGKDFCYLEPSDELKRLVQSRQPADQYKALAQQYPTIVEAVAKGMRIPISDEVLTHIARRQHVRSLRGTPILLRAFKTLMLEDRLEGAMQAVADRLYTPFLLFKLGVQDFGDGTYWIPDEAQIRDFQNRVEVAMSSEFRALITHFGVEVQSVFGREIMPSYKSDRDMIDERIFMTFGLSADMLRPSSSQPYASSALRMEFVGQMLSSYQKILLKHYNARARTVAEAQGHFEMEKKGDMLVPVMEYREVYDENGERRIEERPKPKYPELRFKTMDLRDENMQRQFLREMRNIGIPIADADLMVGVDFDFDASLERKQQEDIKKAIAEAKTKKAIENALAYHGLSEQQGIEDAAASDEQSQDEDAGFDPEPATGDGARPNVSDERKSEDAQGGIR